MWEPEEDRGFSKKWERGGKKRKKNGPTEFEDDEEELVVVEEGSFQPLEDI